MVALFALLGTGCSLLPFGGGSDESARAPAPPALPADADTAFQAADLAYRKGEYDIAYRKFETYVARHPDHPRIHEAIAYEFACARKIAEEGYPVSILGMNIGKSSAKGVELLKDALGRHPFEESADDYYLWLGNFRFQRGEFPEAVMEYEFLAKNYPRSEWLPTTVFQMGRCSLAQFDSIDYDDKPLRGARRHFQRFVDEFPGDQKLETAKRALRAVDQKLAEKELAIARFYLSRGKPDSAARYFKAIVAAYPGVPAAEEARTELARLEPVKGSEK